ncbi:MULTISPECIES: Rieske 2Fe-2S domain-containing protein [Micromonospora]|uniref:(2Fe-2S)-binding protein n=1 Tax=Micromonospora solifontis TaxID=2487138 RepID=A0ABX9WAJ4_9ACTN|nr:MULTISPECIES: Rieske 2Fe-2S domain-containing protein [Micromonospora]NES15738.1 Rieske 2Fe-2S domain-containing protein [Micromonospora sp. PPF5-17B]NES39010.1 Rieske 2Fe-2S domain-containing protein [Micromonospora solifontis]NES56584.1 Rieske 2Fe-2S domain-containing protein [Micromonospora sp. PPF5-6]RNL91977.1 (2Fe-2S)-binding protein [Micromonospora solifontis]
MRELLTKLEQATALDRVGDRLQRAVQGTLRSQRVRDLLHGVWLGHPLHPAMVQVPVGAWISAAVVDLLPGQRRAATALVGVGTASALPAAVAGLNDWASLARDQRRVGLVHAAANVVGLSLYAGSLVARLNGRHGMGRALAYLGLSAASGGAYLGGHLAYKQGAQVSQSISELHLISDGWHPVGDLSSLPQRQLITREIDDVSVILYRHGDDVTVMLERCPHQSGPLGEGEVQEIDGHACVVCPWHGSAFRLNGGEVVHGPSGNDQVILPTRIVEGRLEARLP